MFTKVITDALAALDGAPPTTATHVDPSVRTLLLALAAALDANAPGGAAATPATLAAQLDADLNKPAS